MFIITATDLLQYQLTQLTFHVDFDKFLFAVLLYDEIILIKDCSNVDKYTINTLKKIVYSSHTYK